MTSKSKGPSTKNVEKKKQKVVEDLTFGLKNKNKSKKVQKQIAQVKQQVMGANQKRRGALDPAEEKKLMKQMKKEKEKELKALFNAVEEKKPVQTTQLVEEEVEEEPVVLSIEEQIEELRYAITTKTPVTKDSFLDFVGRIKAAKDAERKAAQPTKVSAVTGLGLFAKDASLFVDDANAADAEELVIKEDYLGDIDEDLFADEEEEEDGAAAAREYDPETWKEAKTPKELLTEYLEKRGLAAAVYKPIPVKGGTQLVKVVLPHLDNQEFIPTGAYKTKKVAEHNAALVAYDFIIKSEAQTADLEAPAQ